MTGAVLTLVSGVGGLSQDFVRNAAGMLKEQGCGEGEIIWLAQSEAVDLVFHHADIRKLNTYARGILVGAKCDVFVQPVAGRQKMFLVADMESTIIQQEMLDILGERLGIGEQIAAITAATMRGERNFEEALQERVALLKDCNVSTLFDVARHITLMPGAETLLKTMKAHGAKAWLVTGGFTFFAEPVAERLGFDRVVANQLGIEKERLTGGLNGALVGPDGKRAALMDGVAQYNIATACVVAVGDGANDIPMLKAAEDAGGLGVGYYPKPKVQAAIRHSVQYGDLTALLYAQGYKKSEFALG